MYNVQQSIHFFVKHVLKYVSLKNNPLPPTFWVNNFLIFSRNFQIYKKIKSNQNRFEIVFDLTKSYKNFKF
jgi:hypothetical protein